MKIAVCVCNIELDSFVIKINIISSVAEGAYVWASNNLRIITSLLR